VLALWPERGITPSGRDTSAGADIAVTAISAPAVTIFVYFNAFVHELIIILVPPPPVMPTLLR